MTHVTIFTHGRHATPAHWDATSDNARIGSEGREHHPSDGDVGHPSSKYQINMRKYFPHHTIVLRQEERKSAEHRNEEK